MPQPNVWTVKAVLKNQDSETTFNVEGPADEAAVKAEFERANKGAKVKSVERVGATAPAPAAPAKPAGT